MTRLSPAEARSHCLEEVKTLRFSCSITPLAHPLDKDPPTKTRPWSGMVRDRALELATGRLQVVAECRQAHDCDWYHADFPTPPAYGEVAAASMLSQLADILNGRQNPGHPPELVGHAQRYLKAHPWPVNPLRHLFQYQLPARFQRRYREMPDPTPPSGIIPITENFYPERGHPKGLAQYPLRVLADIYSAQWLPKCPPETAQRFFRAHGFQSTAYPGPGPDQAVIEFYKDFPELPASLTAADLLLCLARQTAECQNDLIARLLAAVQSKPKPDQPGCKRLACPVLTINRDIVTDFYKVWLDPDQPATLYNRS